MVSEGVGGVSGQFESQRRGERRPTFVVVVVHGLVRGGHVLHELVHPGLGRVSRDGGDGGNHRRKHRRALVRLRRGEQRLEQLTGVRADQGPSAKAQPGQEPRGARARVETDAGPQHPADGGHQLLHDLVVHVVHEQVEGLAHGAGLRGLQPRVLQPLLRETNRGRVLLYVVQPGIFHRGERLEEARDHRGDMRSELRATRVLGDVHHDVHRERLNLANGGV